MKGTLKNLLFCLDYLNDSMIFSKPEITYVKTFLSVWRSVSNAILRIIQNKSFFGYPYF